MICEECQTAGDFNAKTKFALAQASHQECKGDCTCLHKTGAGWYVRAGEKPKPMQTQSP